MTALISCSHCVIYKAGLAPRHAKMGDMGVYVYERQNRGGGTGASVSVCVCVDVGVHDAAYRWVSSHPMEKKVFVFFTSWLDLNTGCFSKSTVLPWLGRSLDDCSTTVLSSHFTKSFTLSFM